MADLDRRRAIGGLLLVIALALVLRLIGSGWGGQNLLHPDERFLAMVTASLESNENVFDYFNTAESTLNPENAGSRPNFVYGTYPLIMVRLLGEVVGWSGFLELKAVGRLVSAGWDLLTIWIVYLLGARLADRRTGLLAAFFLAVTVLHIQQSHYFTVDLAQTFFVTLALYLAVRICEPQPSPENETSIGVAGLLRRSRLGISTTFAVVAAAAVAAKLSAAPVVLLLPAAHLARLLQEERTRRVDAALPILVVLATSGLVFGLTFRVLQPYAFVGPGFFDLGLNPRWVQAIEGLRSLTGPEADWPPAMQWARRSVLYSGKNLVLWGFGLPLGLLAMSGLIAAGRDVLRRGVSPLAIAVVWAAGYFSWQSLASNPTMRYQLPVYPTLAFFAAWLLVRVWRRAAEAPQRAFLRRAVVATGAIVCLVTTVWAAAFTGIYVRPITREAGSRWILAEVPGPVNLMVDTPEGARRQPVAVPYDTRLDSGASFQTRTNAKIGGTIRELTMPGVSIESDRSGAGSESGPPELHAVVSVEGEGGEQSTAVGECTVRDTDGRFRCTLALEAPLDVDLDAQLRVELQLLGDGGRWARLEGGAIANETSWDDGLPLRIDGYDPYGGIYQRELNLELYWNDDQAKRERMLDILHRADYLTISSSRQWASLTRIPERFPLVTTYYRNLVGCPAERSVASCFVDAQVGVFDGELGFELVAVFDSPPSLGPLSINDQPADEAFTVYDHPKVMIFRKTADYDPVRVREIFETVDLDRVIPKPPGHFGRQPADLMLPDERFERQKAGGTWRQRFPPEALVNRHPAVAAVAWYLALALLGLGTAPLVRWALPGLTDRGLPLARGFGLLLLAWTVWILGSLGVSVGPELVRVIALAMITVGAFAIWKRRESWLRDDNGWRHRLITAEGLFLVFFLIGLGVRFVNPDLWHPAHGGEKPMDLTYFTASLKTVTFPPYDPWFAGGYINYYYYGFVIVGQLALGLGIQPSVAYNLALPTLVALAAAGAFSVASNMVAAAAPRSGTRNRPVRPELAGVLAATAVTLLGNLHPIRMFVGGLVSLGAKAGGGAVSAITAGIGRLVSGEPLPIPSHHWFWNPTRIIPDPDVMPITEVPAFTLIYGDLHAHLMDLPQVLLAMAFSLAVLVGWPPGAGRGRRLVAVALGALAVGAMRPTNTWSYYPFLALGMIAVAWARLLVADRLPDRIRLFRAALWAAAFAILTRIFYLPFDAWFGMGYSELVYWDRSRTPLAIYLEHWAPFLFPVATWLVLEVRDWLAATPISAVRPLRRHLGWLLVLGVAAVAGLAALLTLGVAIGWLVWPLLVMAGLLLLRRDVEPGRRFALLAVGLGLGLTLVVELVTLKFDLGRMNTVFKFYFVAWALLGVVAAAGLWWRAADRSARRSWATGLWWVVAISLLAGAAVFPLRAIPAKARDRMAAEAPFGLDGLAYLEHAVHHDQGRKLVLAEDLAAIRWLQRNVTGSPVVVEANIPEYRWGSRIAINTGLPSVVGWNWHQRQQRAYATDRWVWDRVNAVGDFYGTGDRSLVRRFLDRYDVEWIVVGQLERAYYPEEGLQKFQEWQGDLWRLAWREGETSIYEVLP
jgi:YYY domain-containing protein